MHKEVFRKLNEEQEAVGAKLFANLVMQQPQSPPAGLGPDGETQSELYAYGYGEVSEMPADTQSGLLDYLKSKASR